MARGTSAPAVTAQPSGTIFQFAYTTADAEATARAWTATLGIGPWLVRGSFTAPGATYRGGSSLASLTVARTFDGSVMVELIQTHDNHPSIFRETIERGGYGFHHVAIASETFDSRAEELAAIGGPAVFEDLLLTGARVAFFEGAPGFPGMVELVELTEAQEQGYAALRDLCTQWDGTDPWRTS